MYCTWESIDTDGRRRRRTHLNLSYYLMISMKRNMSGSYKHKRAPYLIVCCFMLIRLLPVVAVVEGGTALWWYGIPRVEYLEVLLRTQQVSCDGTLEYFTYLEVPKMSFGKESTRTDQPNFPPQRFLTKAILTASMLRQRRTKRWAGLKMDLKQFELFFCPSNLSAKKTMLRFRSISLKLCPNKTEFRFI